MYTQTKKGFTLIELLVVIAIVAVLSVVVILTLNPAELLRQARDSSRISDMSTLKSAISLYLADVSSNITIGTSTNCYVSAAGVAANCGARHAGLTTVATTSRAVNGTGWLPVNFTRISAGAPFGNLPADPVNDTTYFYSYAVSSTSLTFELDADMESGRYAASGSGDVESNSVDGGSSNSLYEVGTYPGLTY